MLRLILVQIQIVSILFCFLNLAAAENLYQKIVPITLKVSVRGQGNAEIHLTKRRNLLNTKSSEFYQGTILRRGQRYPVAADKYGNTFRVTFPGKITGSRKSRQRIVRIKIVSGVTKTSSVPSSYLKGKTCDADGDKSHNIIYSAAAPENLHTYKILTISTFADVEWNALYGAAAEHEIANVINTAEALYEQQLGIRFKIVNHQTLQTVPANADPNTILSSFQKSGENTTPANVYHLFTGKDMTGATIGIAYISAICYAPDYAFGVTQSYGILTSNVFAHELGHNFGAQHDVLSPGSLMYPSISYGQQYFSAKSISDITTFLSYFGSCLSDEKLPPSLHGAQLKAVRKNSRVTLTLVSRSNVSIQNVLIRVQINKTTKFMYTNSLGRVVISLKNYKKKSKIRFVSTVVDDNSIFAKLVFKL